MNRETEQQRGVPRAAAALLHCLHQKTTRNWSR
jgi:hypothetical protein